MKFVTSSPLAKLELAAPWRTQQAAAQCYSYPTITQWQCPMHCYSATVSRKSKKYIACKLHIISQRKSCPRSWLKCASLSMASVRVIISCPWLSTKRQRYTRCAAEAHRAGTGGGTGEMIGDRQQGMQAVRALNPEAPTLHSGSVVAMVISGEGGAMGKGDLVIAGHIDESLGSQRRVQRLKLRLRDSCLFASRGAGNETQSGAVRACLCPFFYLVVTGSIHALHSRNQHIAGRHLVIAIVCTVGPGWTLECMNMILCMCGDDERSSPKHRPVPYLPQPANTYP